LAPWHGGQPLTQPGDGAGHVPMVLHIRAMLSAPGGGAVSKNPGKPRGRQR
jgi:hypothetical protein